MLTLLLLHKGSTQALTKQTGEKAKPKTDPGNPCSGKQGFFLTQAGATSLALHACTLPATTSSGRASTSITHWHQNFWSTHELNQLYTGWTPHPQLLLSISKHFECKSMVYTVRIRPTPIPVYLRQHSPNTDHLLSQKISPCTYIDSIISATFHKSEYFNCPLSSYKLRR